MLTGAEAVAWGVKLVKPNVIPVYPITPQTHIIEKVAEFVESGELKAEYIRVESEMTALGAVAGAIIEGSRAFTATASQGLLFMHEVLHWVAGGRLPAVMVICTRGVGAPWTLWCDYQDVLSQRDTGWMQLFATSAQEALDFLIISYKVAEMVNIPVMLALDGFLISHTAEPVCLVSDSMVREFLPDFAFPLSLDERDPFTLWPIPQADKYYTIRRELFNDMISALRVWKEQMDLWNTLASRKYSLLEADIPCGAKQAFLCAGATAGTVKHAIKYMFDNKLGLITLRLFRPFPEEDLRKIASDLETIYVLDKALSYGRFGILAQEVEAVVKDLCQVKNLIVSLGGLDFTPQELVELYERARTTKERVIWRES